MTRKKLEFKNLKLSVSKAAQPIFDQLVSRTSKDIDDRPFSTKKTLFIAAACIGAKHDAYKELEGKVDTVHCEVMEDEDIAILISLAYQKTQDLDILSNPKKIFEIAECYANGGIFFLQDKLLHQPGTPFESFIELILNE